MRFFNRQARALVVTALVVIGAVCGSNGDNPAVLVGQWVSMDAGINVELFKDGTGVIGNQELKWKTEGKRFMLSHDGGAYVVDYNLSGYELTLTSGESNVEVWVKKDKVEEYKKKNGVLLSKQQDCGDRFVKVSVPSANVYARLDPHSVIMQVKYGACLCLLGRGDNWYKVKVDGKDGFMDIKSGHIVTRCGVGW